MLAQFVPLKCLSDTLALQLPHIFHWPELGWLVTHIFSWIRCSPKPYLGSARKEKGDKDIGCHEVGWIGVFG